jgi:glycosyl transferase family 28
LNTRPDESEARDQVSGTPEASWRASPETARNIIALPKGAGREGKLQRGSGNARKVAFVYFDAGGGHRSVANALRSVIREQQRPWEIESLNLQELLDPVDLIRQISGVRAQDVYNLLLKNGWTFGTAQLLPILHALIRLNHSRIVRLLEIHWRESRPDMVVSLIPHFNRQLAESLRQSDSEAPFVTLLTDLADYPPHFWIERESEYLISGTERGREQALALGHSADHVFTTSGLVVNPAFYADPGFDRRQERRSLGLESDLPTGLVLFGGQGSEVMLKIAHRLKSFDNLQLIFIAGRNSILARRLREIRCHIPVHVEGYTTRVPYYMRLSNFFIGKPGPGSISEATVLGLPVIVERNAWTMPQEQFNTEWIEKKGLGLVVRSFRQIGEAVEQMLEPATMLRFRQNALAVGNRAVFEVPEILDYIFQRDPARAPAERARPTESIRRLVKARHVWALVEHRRGARGC